MLSIQREPAFRLRPYSTLHHLHGVVHNADARVLFPVLDLLRTRTLQRVSCDEHVEVGCHGVKGRSFKSRCASFTLSCLVAAINAIAFSSRIAFASLLPQ